jgi:hypothetical protein
MGFSEVYTEVPKTAIHLVGNNDWQADLAKNGYAVVKGAVPKERAEDYTNRMHQYLEDLYVLSFQFRVESIANARQWSWIRPQ